MTFDDLNLPAPIKQSIDEMGFSTPSPIQQAALPLLLGNATDFIGLAATGTGKTAAFGIPLLTKIDTSVKAVQALILCPTRELALQVAGQINLLGKHMGLKALPVYGGSDYANQIHGLKQGAKIVVGTPGRVIDHIERGTLKLKDVSTVVLDEADEMISMGFKEDLETILQTIPQGQSKTWLFSATMDKQVRKVADTYLRMPKQAQVNRKEMLSETVEQLYFPVREGDKPEILCKIIDAADDFYGIVFCQTKTLTMDLTQYMLNRGYKVDQLHGDKSQKERERSMAAFRNRNVRVLVCTDVASRGLDVKDITHVVNYSLPREIENYVHRIGRTARSGKSGTAISLVTPSHRGLLKRIESVTKSKMKEGKIPTRREIGVVKLSKILDKFMKQGNYERAMELFSDEWKTVLSVMSAEEIVGRFLAMTAPDVFEFKDKEKPLIQPSMNESREERQQRESRGPRKAYRNHREDRGDHREGRRDFRDDRGGGHWHKSKKASHRERAMANLKGKHS